MAEKITNFLHYGASPGPIESVNPSVADDFVPSLVLSATDDPSIAPPLLFPLVSNRRTPKAMAYASLDYNQVRQLVAMEEEQEADKKTTQETDSEDDCWERDWGLSNQHCSVDECLAFESADEINRAKIVIDSLRRRAYELYAVVNSGTDTESWWIQQRKDEGSIWSSETFLPDLLCLLPIAVSLCPELLEPEVLVKGLLTAKWGAALLAATLINNPLFQERGAMLIADFLSQYIEKCEMDPFSPAVSSLTDKAAPNQSSKDAVQQKLNPRIFHCLQQASWVFVLLCRSVPQLASTCREALVRKCTFAAMVMHITVELLHDELEFFSRIFFSDQKTSKWMLSFFRLAPKDLLMFMPRLARTEMLTDQLMELPSTGLVSDLGKDMERTIKRVRKALLADAEVAFHEEAWRGRLHGHLRLYCVLMHAGDMQPTDEEINFWLNALGGKRISSMKGMVSQPQNIVTERMLQLGIAFFCLVPGVMSSSTKSLCYCCISFLLRPAVSGLASSNPGAEVAVWLVVQLLLRHYPDIALFVRDIVGTDVAVHSSFVRDLCDVAVAAGITSEPSLVAKATASLRPLGPISSTKKNADLLLKCLCQLMQSGHFIRCAVDISEVVMHCISLSAEPIHPMLSQLVQMFAEASSLCLQGEDPPHAFRMQPLPIRFLATAIKPASSCGTRLDNIADKEGKISSTDCCGADLMAHAALATFYIFCREQLLQTTGIYIGYGYIGSASTLLDDDEETGWSKLLAALPLHSLVMYMEDNWLAYEHLFPQWLSLASYLFPEHLLVPKLLQDIGESDNRTEVSIGGVPVVDDLEWAGEMVHFSVNTDGKNEADNYGSKQYFSVDMVKKVFKNALAQPLPALRILKAIQIEAADNKLEVQSVLMSDLVPLLLEESCARPLQKSFCEWWHRLSHAELELLVPLLYNSIKITSIDIEKNRVSNQHNFKASLVNLDLSNFATSYTELAQEPLALLACKNQIFRTPLLSIFLDILMELLVKNKRICLAAVSQGGRNAGLRQEEIIGALTAQDSAVCQILLEACLQSASSEDDIQSGPMLEARQLICAFISSLLDANPILLKLIHFQGYDTQLIPMMMEGVPAMVQCFDFLQELLHKSQQTQQVFAVILAANLVRRYSNHPQSLAVAQQVIS
eukprot:Gb_16868 [translate_table: standard]